MDIMEEFFLSRGRSFCKRSVIWWIAEKQQSRNTGDDNQLSKVSKQGRARWILASILSGLICICGRRAVFFLSSVSNTAHLLFSFLLSFSLELQFWVENFLFEWDCTWKLLICWIRLVVGIRQCIRALQSRRKGKHLMHWSSNCTSLMKTKYHCFP